MEPRKLDSAFSVVGQLRPEDLAQAAEQGFRTVVCNRPDGEAPDQPSSLEMAAEAARLGLAFEYIPVIPGEMDDSDAQRLGKIVSEADGPVLGYCRTGARAEKMWQRAQQLDAPG